MDPDAPDFTNDSVRTFDPVLRRVAPEAAHFLFEQSKPSLSPGSTYENVEFDTECTRGGRAHGPACRIAYVTVRRRSGGMMSNDIVCGVPHMIGTQMMALIGQAHNEAYAR